MLVLFAGWTVERSGWTHIWPWAVERASGRDHFQELGCVWSKHNTMFVKLFLEEGPALEVLVKVKVRAMLTLS